MVLVVTMRIGWKGPSLIALMISDKGEKSFIALRPKGVLGVCLPHE
jgi:hypothetical protein